MARRLPDEKLTTQFIDGCAPQFHHGFGVSSAFDRSTSAYEPSEIADLRQTIERHRASRDPSLVDLDLDLQDCSWDDVRAEIEKAQIAASVSQDRGRKFFPKIWRGIGRAAAVVGPGLDGIPDDLRILRAGLAVIFCMARHRQEVRRKILDAFQDIPDIVEMAQSKSRHLAHEGKNAENAHLQAAVDKLQTTLVQTIPNLIDKLNPGTFLRKATSAFRGFHMDEMLEAVYRQGNQVRVFADTIQDGIITDTHSMARDIRSIAHGTRDEMAAVHRKIDEVLYAQKSLQLNFELVSGKNHLFQFLMEHQKPGSVSEATDRTLVNEHRGSFPTPCSPGSPGSPGHDTLAADDLPRPVDSPATITLHQLLDRLAVPNLALHTDEDHVLCHGRAAAVEGASLQQAALLIHAPPVQQLLHAADRPGIVLAEGCGDRSQTARVSPLSVVCAMLAQTLRTRPASATLLYFCGRHVASDDPLRGPQGMMRSLLVQLVMLAVQHQWVGDVAIRLGGEDTDTDGDPGGDLRDDPAKSNYNVPSGPPSPPVLSLSSVCELFCQFLTAVPPGTEVFCVLDGICFFESADWAVDYDPVMGTLSRVIADTQIGAVFKLLLTTPTRSSRLAHLAPHQRVTLRNTGAQGSLQAALRTVTW